MSNKNKTRYSFDTLEYRWDEFLTSIKALIASLIYPIWVWMLMTIAKCGDTLEPANYSLTASAMLEIVIFIWPLVILVAFLLVISDFYGYWSLKRENEGKREEKGGSQPARLQQNHI